MPENMPQNAKATETQRQELAAAYAVLTAHDLNEHARDFWRMRAGKQAAQVQTDPVGHEHTAIQQYLAWHAADGCRLPAFMRGGERSLAAAGVAGLGRTEALEHL